MQSGAFWATILRNVTVCALTSSRRDDFSDVVIYIVIITIFFSGNLGIWGGGGAREASTPQIPYTETWTLKKEKGIAILLDAPETRYKSKQHGNVGITELFVVQR